MQPPSDDSGDDDQYGPSLPPVSRKPASSIPQDSTAGKQPTSTKVIGPVLPSNFTKSSKYSSDSDSDSSSSSDSDSGHRHRKKLKRSHLSDKTKDISVEKDKRILGPSLPDSDQCIKGEESDDDVIGPSLGLQASESDLSAVNEFESRAFKMKQKLTATTSVSIALLI